MVTYQKGLDAHHVMLDGMLNRFEAIACPVVVFTESFKELTKVAGFIETSQASHLILDIFV
jgi:hypothetical protein